MWISVDFLSGKICIYKQMVVVPTSGISPRNGMDSPTTYHLQLSRLVISLLHFWFRLYSYYHPAPKKCLKTEDQTFVGPNRYPNVERVQRKSIPQICNSHEKHHQTNAYEQCQTPFGKFPSMVG